MDEITSIAQEQKKALLVGERRAASELVRAYGLAYGRIQARVAALTAAIDEARRQGETVSGQWLFERDRLAGLKILIEREMRTFAAGAAQLVTAGQGIAVEMASADAQILLSASAGVSGPSPAAALSGLNSEAVAALAGFAGDGSPLRLLFDKIAPQMAGALADELVSGVIEGARARVIASRIRERSGVGLARAVLIARQETLRAYRTAALRTYRASGVVTRWRWAAAQDARACVVCLLMDGREFPLAVSLNSHVGCRCTLVPVTDATPKRRTGIERFRALEEGVQRELLGKGRYAAYKAGKFQLEDVVGVRYSAEWGTTRYARSLKELLS